jgi:hypothetical protein
MDPKGTGHPKGTRSFAEMDRIRPVELLHDGRNGIVVPPAAVTLATGLSPRWLSPFLPVGAQGHHCRNPEVKTGAEVAKL